MPLIADAFSSPVRPVLRGRFGAVAAAHPLAVAAGQQILAAGGGGPGGGHPPPPGRGGGGRGGRGRARPPRGVPLWPLAAAK